MLVASLARKGKKKMPFYHVIIRNKTSKRDSGIEKLGFFDPMVPNDDPKAFKINMERYNYWTGVGAQPTQRVRRLVEVHKNKSEQLSK